MMKKITLLAALFFAVIAARAQDVYFEDNFDDEDVSDWTLVDSDGDGIQFGDIFQISDGAGGSITPISLISRSWQSDPLTPNNWAISPAIDLSTADGTVTLTWLRQVSVAFPGENYTAYVGTSSDIADLLASGLTLNENFVGVGPSAETNTPKLITLDVSDMIGESEVYVAFRHFDCTDADFLSIDDVRVGQEMDAPDVPEVASNPTPADGATIDLGDNGQVDDDGNPLYGYTFGWDAPTNVDADGLTYTIYIGSTNDINDMTPIQFSGSETTGGIVGLQQEAQYYWAISPSNISGSPDLADLPIWSFNTSNTLGLDDIQATDAFTQYVQAGVLTIESNTQIQSITLFNILGQQVATQNVNNTKGNISLSQLNSGVYLAKVQLDGQTKTFKFIKK